jgi:hypothetical protein
MIDCPKGLIIPLQITVAFEFRLLLVAVLDSLLVLDLRSEMRLVLLPAETKLSSYLALFLLNMIYLLCTLIGTYVFKVSIS